jgi:hypothetical protein
MRTVEQYKALIEKADKRISYLFMLLNSVRQGPHLSVNLNLANVLVSRGYEIPDCTDKTDINRKWFDFRDKIYESIYK